MKKLAFVCLLLICISISLTAYAAQNAPARRGAPPVESACTPTPVVEADGIDVVEDEHLPRLSVVEMGRGTIDRPDTYWAQNGYPDNVSFAYEAGGETLEDGTFVEYWEIGVIHADETGRQAILDLLSPKCRIAFRDCTHSYRERETAFNEIYAGLNDIVRAVRMTPNSEVVFVEISDGYEKEYAKKYNEQYGAFVVVTNDIDAAMDESPTEGANDNAFNLWHWPLCVLMLFAIAMVLFANRTRFVPALQMARGAVVTERKPVSTQETITAIKRNEITPRDEVFDTIMKKIENAGAR